MIGLTVLVICAHPDDEALGCGGTIARLAAQGAEVHLLFLADGVNARGDNISAGALTNRRRMGDAAADALGALPPTYLDFPDNRLDSVPLLEVVTEVERVARPIRPVLVLTHFSGDLNVDHRICAQAVCTAFRPIPGQVTKSIWSFEVPSSTEWGFGVAGTNFTPHIYVDITKFLPSKISALQSYAEEMRPYPHPRSAETVTALARYRGSSVGVDSAEGFLLLRAIL